MIYTTYITHRLKDLDPTSIGEVIRYLSHYADSKEFTDNGDVLSIPASLYYMDYDKIVTNLKKKSPDIAPLVITATRLQALKHAKTTKYNRRLHRNTAYVHYDNDDECWWLTEYGIDAQVIDMNELHTYFRQSDTWNVSEYSDDSIKACAFRFDRQHIAPGFTTSWGMWCISHELYHAGDFSEIAARSLDFTKHHAEKMWRENRVDSLNSDIAWLFEEMRKNSAAVRDCIETYRMIRKLCKGTAPRLKRLLAYAVKYHLIERNRLRKEIAEKRSEIKYGG